MPAGLAEPDLLIVEDPREVRSGGPGGGGPRDLEPGGRGGGDDDDFARRFPGGGGPSVGMLGMVAMMVSITALFATIVIAFTIRSRTRAEWQPVALPWGLWASTGLILLSSLTVEAARRAFVEARARVYGNWLLATFFLALGFIVSQAMALRHLVDQGVYLRRNPHSSLFYVITGTHALHVFGGLLALFYLIYRVSLRTSDSKADLLSQRNVLSVTLVYWHFLGVLWVALFWVLLTWH